MKTKITAIGIVVLLGGIGLYNYGRSFWSPVYLKLHGQRTVNEVIAEIREPVNKRLKKHFQEASVTLPIKSITIVGLKEERMLEVWIKDTKEKWSLLKECPFTNFSGKLGPKLKEGDGQIPEGIYGIECLNPNSNYYLSLKISYPNTFDRKKAREDGRKNIGSDIFIHGKSVTIGCIPIGDEAIEELFYMVVKTGKENVKVIISPYDMRKEKKRIEIEEVDWEEELYEKIEKELKEYQPNLIGKENREMI